MQGEREGAEGSNLGVEALLRAGVAALLLGAALGLHRWYELRDYDDKAILVRLVASSVGEGLALGFLALVPALVEGLGARSLGSRRWLILCLVAVWPAALAGEVISVAVGHYFSTLAFQGSRAAALSAFSTCLRRLPDTDAVTLRRWSTAIALVALLAPLRIFRVPTRWQIAILAPIGLALAVTSVPAMFPSACRTYGFKGLALAALVPLAAALSAALAPRIVGWIVRAPSPAPFRAIRGVRPRRVYGLLVALEVVALFVGTHRVYADRPSDPEAVAAQRRAARIASEWHTYLAGKLAPEDFAGLVARSIVIEHHVRRRVGVGDPICVERSAVVQVGAHMQVFVGSTVYADNREFESTPARRLDGECAEVLVVGCCQLPSSHDVRVESAVSLTDGVKEIWSGVVMTNHTVEVERVSVGRELWRVSPARGDEEAVQVDVKVHPRGVVYLGFLGNELPAPAFLRVSLIDERGELLDESKCAMAKGMAGSGAAAILHASSLPAGRHRLRILVRPDPEAALKKSARIDAILDFATVKTVEVEVP